MVVVGSIDVGVVVVFCFVIGFCVSVCVGCVDGC